MKNKKLLIVIVIVVLLIVGIFGFKKYNNYKKSLMECEITCGKPETLT